MKALNYLTSIQLFEAALKRQTVCEEMGQKGVLCHRLKACCQPYDTFLLHYASQ